MKPDKRVKPDALDKFFVVTETERDRSGARNFTCWFKVGVQSFAVNRYPAESRKVALWCQRQFKTTLRNMMEELLATANTRAVVLRRTKP